MLDQIVISGFQPIDGVRVGIDKVVLGIPLVKGGDKDYATKFHIEGEIYNSVHQPKIKKCIKPGRSAVVGKYLNNAKTQRIFTIVVGTVWGNPYCQFILNPNRLFADDWQTIEEILSTCFNYGLAELLTQGVIRKLELSLDFLNTAPSELVTLASNIKSGAASHKGTQYCGKRTSPLSIATYDKAQQLAANEKVMLGHDLTRVEARLVKPAHTLLDVAEGKALNPWSHIFRGVPEGSTDCMWKVFIEPKGNGNAYRELGLVRRNSWIGTQRQERVSTTARCVRT